MKLLVVNGLFQQKAQLPYLIQSLKMNKVKPTILLTIDITHESNPCFPDEDFLHILQSKICQNVIRINEKTIQYLDLGPLRIVQKSAGLFGNSRLKKDLKRSKKPCILISKNNQFDQLKHLDWQYVIDANDNENSINQKDKVIMKSSWAKQGKYMLLNVNDRLRSCDILRM